MHFIIQFYSKEIFCRDSWLLPTVDRYHTSWVNLKELHWYASSLFLLGHCVLRTARQTAGWFWPQRNLRELNTITGAGCLTGMSQVTRQLHCKKRLIKNVRIDQLSKVFYLVLRLIMFISSQIHSLHWQVILLVALVS